MSKLGTFGKFLSRFAGEYRVIGGALSSLIAGVALQPREAQMARDAVTQIMDAANNIEKSLSTLKEVQPVAPTKAQVQSALKDLLPDMLGGLVETEVRKRLEAANK